MFVWVFHRVTGLLLIVLLSFKFLTSFFLMTKDKKPDWALVLHTNPLIDCLLIVSVVSTASMGSERLSSTSEFARKSSSSGCSQASAWRCPAPCWSSISLGTIE